MLKGPQGPTWYIPMVYLKSSVGYLPGSVVDNRTWSQRKGLDTMLHGGDALERAGGVSFRRVWDADVARPLHVLSAQAARLVTRSPPRRLLHASTTPEATSPATAHRVHGALGLPPTTAACDVTSSCTSALMALGLAAHDDLVVAAEAKSRHVAVGDGRTAALFGDASIAMRVATTPAPATLWLEPFVDTELADNIRVVTQEDGHQRLVMANGKLMFRRTVAAFITMIERALVTAETSGWTLARVYVHQASGPLLAEVKRHFPSLFVPVLIGDIGNTVAVSLPLHRLRVLTLLALEKACPGLADAADPTDRQALLRRVHQRYVVKDFDPSAGIGAAGLSCRYGDENLVVLDGAAADGDLGSSWLARVTPREWQRFFAELRLPAAGGTREGRPLAEAWIGAGGGFQALGFVAQLPGGSQRNCGQPELLEAAQWS